jgi:uncharacterized membrane protein
MHSSTLYKGIAVAFVISLVGDMVWHSVLMADFYGAYIASINGAPWDPSFPLPLIVFELICSAVMAYFILAAAKAHTVTEGAWHGALLGLAIVGAVNFVNHSLMPKWDITLLMVDTAWGIVLGAVTGAAVMRVAAKSR